MGIGCEWRGKCRSHIIKAELLGSGASSGGGPQDLEAEERFGDERIGDGLTMEEEMALARIQQQEKMDCINKVAARLPDTEGYMRVLGSVLQ